MIEIDFGAVAAGVGFLLPLVISFAKQSSWSNQVKKGFSFVAALVAAVVTVGVQEGWTTLDVGMLVASLGIILPMAQASYTGFWEDNPVEVRLAQAFDRTVATSVTNPTGSEPPRV